MRWDEGLKKQVSEQAETTASSWMTRESVYKP
jgi:hypothetical protein